MGLIESLVDDSLNFSVKCEFLLFVLLVSSVKRQCFPVCFGAEKWKIMRTAPHA